jgi:hypothetical protein
VARDEPAAVAREALHALATLRGGEALFERSRIAIAGRPELGDALARAFGART